MGIDIKDIVRVVQWGLTSLVTMLTLWQRLGRAGQAPNIQGVGIIFYTKPLHIGPLERGPLKILRDSMHSNKARQIINMVISSDMRQVKQRYEDLQAQTDAEANLASAAAQAAEIVEAAQENAMYTLVCAELR